jgi:hypothetical protein
MDFRPTCHSWDKGQLRIRAFSISRSNRRTLIGRSRSKRRSSAAKPRIPKNRAELKPSTHKRPRERHPTDSPLQYSFSGIEVHDPRFRTRTGLGVGSTLSDLQRLYPGAEVGHIDADGGPSVVIEQLGLTFAMDVLRSYTRASRVKSVWVYPCPVTMNERDS